MRLFASSAGRLISDGYGRKVGISRGNVCFLGTFPRVIGTFLAEDGCGGGRALSLIDKNTAIFDRGCLIW